MKRLLTVAAFLLLPLAALCAEPPGAVMFGDSTTNFRPGAVEKVYSVRVQEAFDAAGEKIRVINRGVGADNTDRARKRFTEAVLAEKPAVVVIQFGINDSAVDVWKKPPATGPRVSQKDYVANLRWMANKARRAGIEVIFMTPNPMRWAAKIRRRYGKPPYDADDPLGYEKPFFRGHVEAMRDLAAELRVPLVDVYAAYGEREKKTGEPVDTLLLDGVHPNDKGHALLTEKLLPVIREALRR